MREGEDSFFRSRLQSSVNELQNSDGFCCRVKMGLQFPEDSSSTVNLMNHMRFFGAIYPTCISSFLRRMSGEVRRNSSRLI